MKEKVDNRSLSVRLSYKLSLPQDAKYVDESFAMPNTSQLPSQMFSHNASLVDDGVNNDTSLFDGPDFDDFGEPDDEIVFTAASSRAIRDTRDPVFKNPTATPANSDWTKHDAHDAESGTELSNPFRRIKTYRLPAVLVAKPGTKQAAATKSSNRIPISQFCAESFCSRISSRKLPRSSTVAPAYPEFAALFWAEQKSRASTRNKQAAASKEAQATVQAAANSTLAGFDALELSAVNLTAGGYDDDDGGMSDNGFDDDGGFATVDAADASVLFGDASMVSHNGNQGFEYAPDLMAAREAAGDSAVAAAAMSYEDLVRSHIEKYIAESQQYVLPHISSRIPSHRIRCVTRRSLFTNGFGSHTLTLSLG